MREDNKPMRDGLTIPPLSDAELDRRIEAILAEADPTFDQLAEAKLMIDHQIARRTARPG